MSNPLFDYGSPEELAERKQVIDFKGKLHDFPRLAEIVEQDLERIPAAERPREWRRTQVRTRLAFSWLDERREIPRVAGSAAAVVCSVCQRCLEPFELEIETPVRYLFGPDDGSAAVKADSEIWELEGPRFRPLDLVEESLVMAMPLAPAHAERASCGALASGSGEEKPATIRPFADLKSRMKSNQRTPGKKPGR